MTTIWKELYRKHLWMDCLFGQTMSRIILYQVYKNVCVSFLFSKAVNSHFNREIRILYLTGWDLVCRDSEQCCIFFLEILFIW